MKRPAFILFSLFVLSMFADAQQSRHIVWLSDKNATTFSLSSPGSYLSQRAIERRTRYSIGLDSSDIPVPLTYLAQLAAIPNVTVLNVSRWLNAVSIQTTDAAAIIAIRSLPFVQSTQVIAGKPKKSRGRDVEEVDRPARAGRHAREAGADYFNYGTNSYNEIHLHNGEFLHNAGLRGQGMQIAMLDGGFYNYTAYRAFDSVNQNNQVLGTWDFVARNASVTEDAAHGMQCFSTIAANIPGQFVGKAPKASFYLYRTEETATEYPIEEFNWACGAERADSAGADVISSSLGYGYDFDGSFADYDYDDLNGDITISARAADMAAQKGLLVFNSAGNSGNDSWRFITTPADADSIIAVAAVNTSGTVGSFSSYGPAPDGRVKPELASVGVAALVQTTANTVGTANGTSFAAPNLAGLSTCLWQGFPEVNNMRIIRALKESGNKSSTPDDRVGYGIPDMRKAFLSLLKDFATASIEEDGCTVKLRWTSKDVNSMRYDIERKGPGENVFTKVAAVNTKSGTVLATNEYEFETSLNGLPVGNVQYRIRQIADTTMVNDASIYIDTLATQIETPCVTSTSDNVVVAPTPTPGDASVIVSSAVATDKLFITVHNLSGEQVYRQRTAKSVGSVTLPIPVANLSRGVYVVTAFDDKHKIGRAFLLKL